MPTPAPTPRVVIEPQSGWVPLALPELWRYRELVGFLALRDLKVRYKQSLLGAAWALLQPLLTLAVFTGARTLLTRGPRYELQSPLSSPVESRGSQTRE